ncbi:MAG: NADH-quinone oxidoreductase subunit NuoG [Caulobacterales bacterium]
MTKILVDGVETEVPGEYTLLQACEAGGAEIPRFCYHERLSIAGNCRMCLIEVKIGGRAGPKPVASCAQQIKDLPPSKDDILPELVTKSPAVKKAREGVMEFLLINHPLDCPVCDQGGECDLQDQSMAYGRPGSRFEENKRAVEEKYMGPLIKTEMNRCIQCTRCIRFISEVAGVEDIGAAGRGEDMEITTYLEASVGSELSGNVVDLCPVGALTSKPYAFHARPWELKKTESVDVMDALGSNIRVDSRGPEVMRVLPRVNEEINEEWISDKTRHVVDGLKRQRLDKPYARKGGSLMPVTWDEALTIAGEKLSSDSSRIGVIAGDLVCAESLKASLDLLNALGIQNRDCRQDGSILGGGAREGYLFNSTIAGIEKADALLLVGVNPRTEAPILNARIRKAWLRGGLDRVALIGAPADLTYPYQHLGMGADALGRIANGSPFLDVLKNAKRPAIILGQSALNRPDSAAILAAAGSIAAASNMVRGGDDAWNGFNVLHNAAGRVAGLDLGFLPGAGGKDTNAILAAAQSGAMDTILLLAADEIDAAKFGSAFVIYVGSHGDAGASRADLVLPGAAYTEKDATWVNTEGRVQYGQRAVFPKGDAREDWAIFRALSQRMGRALPYDNLQALRAKMIADHPTFGGVDYAPGAHNAGGFDPSSFGKAGSVSQDAFMPAINNFYFTNPIARASRIMAECSRAAQGAGQIMRAAE